MSSIKIRCRAVIIHEEKLMVVRNVHPNGPADFYALPGGHMENGEDPKVCVERELFEELGVHAQIGRLLFVHTITREGSTYAVEFFFEVINSADFMHHADTEKTHAHEIAEVRWIERGERERILPESFAEIFHSGNLRVNEVQFLR